MRLSLTPLGLKRKLAIHWYFISHSEANIYCIDSGWQYAIKFHVSKIVQPRHMPRLSGPVGNNQYEAAKYSHTINCTNSSAQQAITRISNYSLCSFSKRNTLLPIKTNDACSITKTIQNVHDPLNNPQGWYILPTISCTRQKGENV